MRGLAFPEAAVSDRDESTDHGTPFSSSNADDIPIDPALTGIPLDPALFDQTNEIPAQQVGVCALSAPKNLTLDGVQ